jgi:hypothetical protein
MVWYLINVDKLCKDRRLKRGWYRQSCATEESVVAVVVAVAVSRYSAVR